MNEELTLYTARLTLRPHRLSDAEDVYEFASDYEWGRFMPLPKPYLREHAEQFVADSVNTEWAKKPTWAIELDGKVIGGIRLKIDVDNEVAEIGYSLARPHWNKGFMTEAAGAAFEFGFEERGLAKIFAQADTRNHGSIRVMQKLGMTHEGTLRSHRLIHGERVDWVVYGLLRNEWAKASS